MAVADFAPRRLPLRQVPPLARHEAHVWRVRIANLPLLQAAAGSDRADRLRQRRMGQRFVLRLLLGAYLGMPGREVVVARSTGRKPALAASLSKAGLAFNVSHAGDLLAIAVAREVPVGIDIEPRRRVLRAAALARRWFDAAEADLLGTLSEADARDEFLRRWCVREAVIKARGGTIAEHLRDIAPDVDDATRLVRLPHAWGPPEAWDVQELTGDPELFGVLAAPRRLGASRGFALEWLAGDA